MQGVAQVDWQTNKFCTAAQQADHLALPYIVGCARLQDQKTQPQPRMGLPHDLMRWSKATRLCATMDKGIS